ncbi:Alpha/Beta hydrolase protein [Xylariales sp. AK1849]|nr:Alpha/Beta hydrolase protein [Xylariales sp. AK1849]
MWLLVLYSSLAALFLSSGGNAALTTVTNWGANPTNLEMQIYLPAKLAANPPVVVALHGCTGSGSQYYQEANYSSYADAQGFIVIYPSSHNDSNCWDVSSAKSLTHGGGGDSEGLTQMVDYLVKTYNADPTKVYATGSSSGCMMTNVLLATYPDVFAAGSCYSGVAAGCFAGSPGSSPTSSDPACADGKVIKTGDEWAAQVHAMYPTYNGTYPRMQTFHGTADNLVFYANLGEQLKEWSTLLGVSFSRNVTNSPQSEYTKMIYGDGTKLIGYSAVGVGHTVPVHLQLDMEWFGLI